MTQTISSSEIAERTLAQLTKEGLPPTPKNYEAIYNKIAGGEVSASKELLHQPIDLNTSAHNESELIEQMAQSYISRLSSMSKNKGEYPQKLEEYQHQLSDIQQTKIEEAEQKIQVLTSALDYINGIASEDYLTRTLNRRGMNEALEREFNRADRHGTPLCIAVMDIDHFKKLNDKLGHNGGDEALVHFAQVIKDTKRTTDVLARYGGEEFVIILPNTEQGDAVKVIKRMQHKLSKQCFTYNTEQIVIKFSSGVAQRTTNETPEEIIPRADGALYQAKNAGRNRVIAADTAVVA